MANIFIIHGAYGKPNEIWLPWLKKELEVNGHKAYIPRFPTPNNQSLKSWLTVFSKYISKLDGNSIMVGHSLGPAFILSVLELIEKPIGACYLVAPFIGKLNNSRFDIINKTFCQKKFNWQKIRKNCKKFYIYTSKNDSYVPIKKALHLCKRLKTKPTIIAKAGHFQSETGYGEKFEKLLSGINKQL